MQYIKYNKSGGLAYITLDRPEKSNALNGMVVGELKKSFKKASEDDEVRVVILRANGKAFCAGADLAYLQQLQKNTFEENLTDSNDLKELYHQIYTFNKVVIAQVQGHAIAGGCGLATVCDFIFTVPEAKFGYTEVKIGFVPAIVSIFLIRKIGESKARELLLSGELIKADKAKSFGIVNHVIEPKSLEEEVRAFAGKLMLGNSPQAMSYTKHLIAAVQDLTLEEALNFAADLNARARSSKDCQRGISAFLNKEQVKW